MDLFQGTPRGLGAGLVIPVEVVKDLSIRKSVSLTIKTTFAALSMLSSSNHLI